MTMRDPIAAVTEAISRYIPSDVKAREAAILAIRAVKAQLETDASEQRFISDRNALYCGAEQIGEWVEGQ